MTIFIQQCHIKLVKTDSTDVQLQNISISNNLVLLFLKNPEEIYQNFHKFNIDNKKCFLSTKSADQNDFWSIMWQWRLD